jgi:Putative Ig domain
MSNRLSKIWGVAIALSITGSCGGGGGSGGLPQATGATGNTAPVITGSPDTSVLIGQPYEFAPSATDADGDTLTFDIREKPSWATFDPVTGDLYGTPDPQHEGRYDGIVIVVSDGSASASLPPFGIAVNQVGTGSITLNWTPPSTNTDGTPLADIAGYNFYIGTETGNYSQVVPVDSPGITQYVLDNMQPDTYYVAATARNSRGSESELSNEITVTVESD